MTSTLNHPEIALVPQSELASELTRLASSIDAHRRSHRPAPSDRAWVKQWTGLGSAKTWGKILKGDFNGLSIETQIPNYRGVLATLDAETRERGSDELYGDLPPAQAVTLTALRLLHHHGKDRLILIEGGSGSSKTSCLELLAQNEAAGNIILVEASDVTWRSPRAAMYDILRALGCSDDAMPNSTAGRLDKILTILKSKGRVMLAIDEAHHANGTILNLFKTLLNKTEVLLILAGMKTLFQKLRAVASEEAKQLIHNRLFARIELTGPDIEGAEIFLMRRLGLERSPWKKSSLKDLVSRSHNSGHWAYMRRVVDHIHDGGLTADEVDDATLLTAAQNAQLEIA
jgi:type II secretory pathway predicted ATPase ExeA